MNADQAIHPGLLSSLGVAALIGFMLWRRFQRLAGPQLLSARGRRRLIIRSAILGVLAVALLLLAHGPLGYIADGLGLAAGTLLAGWSLRHTRFERGPDGQATRYVPNAWIGGAIFALFALRLLWRLWPALDGQMQGASSGFPTSLSSSPWTGALFMLFAGYQIVYQLLVLRQARPQITKGHLA